jgi:ComF family protein
MALIDLVLPPACAGCGRVGELFCGGCRTRLRRLSRTDELFVTMPAGVVIGEALDLALAAWSYDGPLRRALAALKYGGARRLAPILADLTAPALGTLRAIAGDGLLVPVPVHAERRRARGYNQAELLVRRLSDVSGMAWVDALARVRPTTKQHELRRAQRLQNLRGAFTHRSSLRRGSTVILVDDIVTTSATLEACAGVLRSAGAESVYGLAVAREV